MATFVSLFSGIGGLDLAIEAMGFECVAQVEWDKHCTAVLERHWPDVPRWGDVSGFTAATYADVDGSLQRQANTHGEESRRGVLSSVAPSRWGECSYPEITGREARSDDGLRDRARGQVGSLPFARSVDLICGGFPCQPVSTAGRRKAQADVRWLWPEFARVIRELGPRWVVVENVPGLLGAGDPSGSALGEVLRDLAQMGFDARWGSVRASDVGACHRRERIFLLAERADADRIGSHRTPFDILGDAELRDGQEREPGSLGSAHHRERPASDSDSGPLTGTSTAGDGLSELAKRGARPDAYTALNGYERSGGLEEPRPADGPHRSESASGFAWGPYEPAIRRWERTLNRCAPNPVDDKGRLAPPFVEWMMGFSLGWTAGMTRTQALKALGNSVVPQQAIAALRSLS